jgi:hypothetical protein
VGKILRLRQKITSIKDSVTGLFKGGASKDASSQKLDAFKGGCASCLPACLPAGWLGGFGFLACWRGAEWPQFVREPPSSPPAC